MAQPIGTVYLCRDIYPEFVQRVSVVMRMRVIRDPVITVQHPEWGRVSGPVLAIHHEICAISIQIREAQYVSSSQPVRRSKNR